MIRGYTDFAANERTFLAWVRTGIAVIALGFVVERFNLFLLAMAAETDGASRVAQLLRGGSPGGRHGGMALVGVGVAMIFIATVRFLQIARLLEKEATMDFRALRGTLVPLALLVLGVAAFSAYLAIG